MVIFDLQPCEVVTSVGLWASWQACFARAQGWLLMSVHIDSTPCGAASVQTGATRCGSVQRLVLQRLKDLTSTT